MQLIDVPRCPAAGARRRPACALAIFATLAVAVLVAPLAAEAKPRPPKNLPVKVMSRNLFLGADLGPAIGASDAAEFVAANGAILRQVTETDFERRADEDGDPETGPPGLFGGELNGRLTMRDAILVRRDRRLKVARTRRGRFDTQLVLDVAGIEVTVSRGWTALNGAVTRGKRKRRVTRRFRLVNTHLEAFDDRAEVPSIRARQAAELIERGGPASGRKVILVGDLNSDVPGLIPGDEQAFQVLLDGGFVRRSTTDPPSCCVSDLFTAPATEFDHVVDHVLTNNRRKIRLIASRVTGLEQFQGIYPSDHAGVFSRLRLMR